MTEILVRREADSACFDVSVDGRFLAASPSTRVVGEEVLNLVAHAPDGVATVRFEDENSLTARLRRSMTREVSSNAPGR